MTVKAGDTFGRLTVLSTTPSMALCKCACGKLVNGSAATLTSGSLRSCGCDNKPKAKRIANKKQFSWQGTKGAK